MTTVNRVSTLSDEEVQAMMDYWGNDVGAMLTDALANNIPSDQGFSVDDVVAYLLEISGTNGVTYLDPDVDADVVALFEQSEDMLNEFYNLNRSNSELDYLIEDIKAYLESAGVATDSYNEAGQIISDYVAEFGPIDSSSSDSDSMSTELGNLISFFKKFDFATYLALYVLYELGPMVEEGMEVINEKNEDAMEQLEDQIDVIANTDPEDAIAAQEAKAAEYEIQLIQNSVKAYDEIGKLLSDLLEIYNEQTSTFAQRAKQARSSIIQNF